MRPFFACVVVLTLSSCAIGRDPADVEAPAARRPARGPALPGVPRGATVPPSPSLEVADADRRTFEEANRVRVAWGLRPFRWSDRLYVAARAHSEEQERFDYMGHGSPDPSRDDLADRLRIAGYGPASGWAEVVARGYDGPASVMNGWMNSRGHRQILTDPRLEEAAFARVGTSFTGNFATPRR